MPLYEYHCDNCQKNFEVIQKFSDEPITECRLCQGGPVERLLSAPGLHFKGSGWYITDYAKSGGKSPASDGGKADKAEKKDSTAAPAASTPAPSTSTTTKSD